MFGYVVTNNDALRKEDNDIYHSYYCGLCKSLNKLYGQLSTMTLSNDMTFLEIVLNCLYEPDIVYTTENCITHPIRKQEVRRSIYSEYAAKMTIVLAYFKALDDVQDDHKHKTLLKLLEKPFKQVEEEYPDKIKAIREALKKVDLLEKQDCTDIDLLSKSFSPVLGEIFVYQDDIWRDDLYCLGANLGKFIYIMDAYDDIEEDLKKDRFNPLKSLYTRSDFDDYCQNILELFISEGALAYERLPILKNSGILNNILYSGVWNRFAYVKNKRNEIVEESHESL